MYVNRDNVTYFDSFEVEYIPKKLKKCIGHKIQECRIQDICRIMCSIMCGCVCTEFIDFMIKGKS